MPPSASPCWSWLSEQAHLCRLSLPPALTGHAGADGHLSRYLGGCQQRWGTSCAFPDFTPPCAPGHLSELGAWKASSKQASPRAVGRSRIFWLSQAPLIVSDPPKVHPGSLSGEQIPCYLADTVRCVRCIGSLLPPTSASHSDPSASALSPAFCLSPPSAPFYFLDVIGRAEKNSQPAVLMGMGSRKRFGEWGVKERRRGKAG